MKTIILISLLIVLLTACSAPMPSPTATVTVLPISTSTAVDTVTPKAPLAPTLVQTVEVPGNELEVAQDGYLSDLNFKENSSITDFEYMGVVLSATTNVEQSGWGHGIHEVIMPDELLAKITLRVLHALFAPSEADDEASLKAFCERWANVRSGETSANISSIIIKSFDANRKTDKPEEMTLVLNGMEGQVHGASVIINNVNIVYGAWYDDSDPTKMGVSSETPWFHLVTQGGNGSGVLIDSRNNALFIFIGMPYIVNEENSHIFVGTSTELAIDYLRYFSQGKGNNFHLTSTQKQLDDGRIWISQVMIK